jgi:hypothetical protein
MKHSIASSTALLFRLFLFTNFTVQFFQVMGNYSIVQETPSCKKETLEVPAFPFLHQGMNE